MSNTAAGTVNETLALQVGEASRFYNLVVSPITDDSKVTSGTLVVLNDVTELQTAREQQASITHDLQAMRAMVFDVTTVEERERRRIAQIIHDEIGQAFTGALLHLPGTAQTPLSDTTIASVRRELEAGLARSRSLTAELNRRSSMILAWCPPYSALRAITTNATGSRARCNMTASTPR